MTFSNVTIPPSQEQGSSSKKLVRVAAIVVVVFALLVIGWYPHFGRQREAAAASDSAAATHPVVAVTQVTTGEPTTELSLPGNILPLYTANLYARVDGYLERRNVEIGARVKSGQVIAVIASPEIDQQLLQAQAALEQAQASVLQAKAALKQAQANAELSRLTKDRDVPLGQQQAISQQVVDAAVQSHDARLADVSAAEANVVASQANVSANRANVARLQQMQQFEHIVAPFDGVITARNIERGDLVSVSGNTAKPLFSIAQSGTLRIQVDVPQSEVVNIRDGQKTKVTVRELFGREYTGVITHTAGALDAAARTMLTEVQVDNRDGSLLPGMYAQVKFTLPHQRTSLVIPTSALIANHTGMHVVTVDDSHVVHVREVVIGKDMGTTVEIISGLRSGETIAASPSDLLSEGQHVEVR